jgi:hypothetical protein
MLHVRHQVFLAALLSAGLVLSHAPASSQEQRQCPSLKAADGSCVDPGLVAAANRRAAIVASQFTSYLGTPMGSVGTPFIPQERLFRDDTRLYGLPTNLRADVLKGDKDITITTTRSK